MESVCQDPLNNSFTLRQPLERLRALAVVREILFFVPDFDAIEETHDHDVFVETGDAPKNGGDDDASLLVEFALFAGFQDGALKETDVRVEGVEGGKFLFDFFPGVHRVEGEALVETLGEDEGHLVLFGQLVAETRGNTDASLVVQVVVEFPSKHVYPFAMWSRDKIGETDICRVPYFPTFYHR